jgi:hypothetical protein
MDELFINDIESFSFARAFNMHRAKSNQMLWASELDNNLHKI